MAKKNSKAKTIVLAIFLVFVVGLLVFAKVSGTSLHTSTCLDCSGTGIVEEIACETCEGTGQVRGSYWALVPPLIAIGLAPTIVPRRTRNTKIPAVPEIASIKPSFVIMSIVPVNLKSAPRIAPATIPTAREE